MPRYFAYGSNMSRARLELRVGRVGLLGRAKLDAHRHRFSKLGVDGTGKGNVEVHDAASVWGVAYELDDAQLARLTQFEFGYRMCALNIELDAHGTLDALSYQALTVVDGLAPTPAYLEHYLIGMREHELPVRYREQVLAEFAHLLEGF